MEVVRTIADLRQRISSWRVEGQTVSLVPTMGALHDGHISLIKKSMEKCDNTVISIYVNPLQFSIDEDFDLYPKNFESDLIALSDLIASKTNSINRWRLKASNIWINNNGWKAKKVSFTNDPFNPAQSRIEAFKVELLEIGEDKENYILTAEKSYLVLEDKIKIPLGNRKITKEGLEDWKRFEKCKFE